ncbi:peptide deformylase [Nicoletella semolina]|uniref:Peptide deformylase n=1 Tax=Nicoletella semolina TaxID=271160 RepID=A0A4R2NB97_9PAST|nr:peptide deformylase [Nicoletella semolina]MDH2924798.1 peptide deformylase [Nicoletella semolina]TCP18330.1 peptide deformylase [Nicoletella semolina]
MAVLEVVIYPDETLATVCEPVAVVDEQLAKFIDDMFDTMYHHEGIGLAAPQVAVLKRVIVIDIEGDKTNQIVLINPEIIESSGETGIEEGCLSIPGCRALVPRKEKVKVVALDRYGKPFELEADGLLAICIQHEIDHINGILFVDHISALKRQRFRDKMVKLKKQLKKDK